MPGTLLLIPVRSRVDDLYRTVTAAMLILSTNAVWPPVYILCLRWFILRADVPHPSAFLDYAALVVSALFGRCSCWHKKFRRAK